MTHDPLTLTRIHTAALRGFSHADLQGELAATLAGLCVLIALVLIKRAIEPIGALVQAVAGVLLAMVMLVLAVVLLAIAVMR
jgi:hypothetical protein